MSDDERIRAYVRRRADVNVPDDLRLPAAKPGDTRRWVAFRSLRPAMSAAAVVLTGVIAAAALSLSTTTGPTHPATGGPSPSTASSGGPASVVPSPGDSSRPGAAFPSEVAGLPVISVAAAVELLKTGQLNGRVVAVAGYLDQFAPSCPFPGRYIGPLVSWCRFVAFADTAAAARLCVTQPHGDVSCGQAVGTHLAPFFMPETSGGEVAWPTTAGEPDALVLIGHAGDPRQWQCTPQTQAECAAALAVDRVAWKNGHDVALASPSTGDQVSGKPITPRMTLAQVAAAAGIGDGLLTAVALRAGDIATIDPRWNLAGDNVVWLARSLGSGSGSPRAETVWVVDDTTGRVIGSRPLASDGAYQPARLWTMATAHGVDCCGGALYAFDRVIAADGTVVAEGMVPGGQSGMQGETVYGGGYESQPLVLPAGRYSISVWLATDSGGVMGAPRDECSSQVDLQPLGEVALNADFPSGQACTMRPAPTQTPSP